MNGTTLTNNLLMVRARRMADGNTLIHALDAVQRDRGVLMRPCSQGPFRSRSIHVVRLYRSPRQCCRTDLGVSGTAR
jgi:hypothetical protein